MNNNIRVPRRPAPGLEMAAQKLTQNGKLFTKKKPPPRPPPPNFNKSKSQSAWNLSENVEISLIEWSPPNSPKTTSTSRQLTGSVSSSFSGSTSSLASSKKSFDYETMPLNNQNNFNPWNNNIPFPFPNYGLQSNTLRLQQESTVQIRPTIIRPHKSNKSKAISNNSGEATLSTLPMPIIPPPSPPIGTHHLNLSPFGIALYDYVAYQHGDLSLQVNDIVYLLRRVNEEWLYGKVGDREGMFPANFIDIQVPLPLAALTKHDGDILTAMYKFNPQMHGDLELKVGQQVKIIQTLSDDWSLGESNGLIGQFPTAFAKKMPSCVPPTTLY